MNPEQYQRLKSIYQQCRGIEPDDRQAFLDQACQGDESLRSEVERLFSGTARGDFMDSPLSDMLNVQSGVEGLAGVSFGQFQLQRVISTGGMGTVYEALQQEPLRTVAVKVMRLGDHSGSGQRRFRQEAQILARLRHANIAQVIESGTWKPESGAGGGEAAEIPYLVMEYVDNAFALTEYAVKHGLDIKNRLKLFLQVCEAMALSQSARWSVMLA